MKPSPIPSILLFVATAMLAFSMFGRGWYGHESETFSLSGGPLWSTVCFERNSSGIECETHTAFSNLSKNPNGFTLLSVLLILTGISGLILAGVSGLLLLKKPRAGTTLVTIILLGVSLLIVIGSLMFGLSRGGSSLPGYGFFVYLLGAILALVGGVLGMSASRGGVPHRQMGPPGYLGGYPPGPGQPGYGIGPAPYSQPAPAHMACGTQMSFVAQHQRWFCPRCNQYS